MKNMKRLIITAVATVMPLMAAAVAVAPINRKALVERNNPHVTSIDTLASLSVGNGGFACTVDVTGLQTFPELYSGGVPLGTQSDWGWHSFPNPQGYRFEETLAGHDFGRGRIEPYACQFKEKSRRHDASDWFRVNPHRLHLGAVGFGNLRPEDISDVDQTLDMWRGEIRSSFRADGTPVSVCTYVDPGLDELAATIKSKRRLPVVFRFPYPTGGHCDDAFDMSRGHNHIVTIENQKPGSALIRHTLDNTTYYVSVTWSGKAKIAMSDSEPTTVVLTPSDDSWSFTALFSPTVPANGGRDVSAVRKAAARYWKDFWMQGGAVDFSRCTDPRARELERRVVLSQYLLAIQCAGDTPPQETGLTYNSWFGKFHMEMIWWHQAQFALWNHPELLARTLGWYKEAEPAARSIAARQGFKGVRWMKMTDPSGLEAPSNVGSFLIWQQPHPIYLAELLYRVGRDRKVIDSYYPIVEETARFMADFVTKDKEGRYELLGLIPAQETLRAAETVNPPFELSYWHFGLSTAQKWRERKGLDRVKEWDDIIAGLSPLATADSLYLAAETAPETYSDIRLTSDHMAVLAALGVLPGNPLIDKKIMSRTADWVFKNWNWNKTWGWDYPVTAMNAARLGMPERAVDALLMDNRTNTYLPNGHNYQDGRLRCYLPGNGGLLTAVAMMCAGWDGCTEDTPGFPKDGSWNVRWENLSPLP